MRGPYGKLWTEFFPSFALGPWKQGRKKRGSITCPTDWENEANKLFIIWLCRLCRFWKSDRELEVRTSTYGPGIDQSQHANSVSHIIIGLIVNVSRIPKANLPYSHSACAWPSSIHQRGRCGPGYPDRRRTGHRYQTDQVDPEISDSLCLPTCLRSFGVLLRKYSGTPLIRPPTGQNKVVVLTGWSY